MKNIKTGVAIDKRTDEELKFNFQTDLTIKEKIRFVSSVVNTVVNDNYYSFLKDLIFDFEIIEMFTDIDTSDISEATDRITAMEEFVNNTNAVEIVKANSENVIAELYQAVEDDLEFKTGVHHSTVLNSLEKLINSLDNALNKNYDDIVSMAKKINEMGDINTEDIFNALIEKILSRTDNKVSDANPNIVSDANSNIMLYNVYKD